MKLWFVQYFYWHGLLNPQKVIVPGKWSKRRFRNKIKLLKWMAAQDYPTTMCQGNLILLDFDIQYRNVCFVDWIKKRIPHAVFYKEPRKKPARPY